jgi:hypothetical protein
MPAFSGLRHSGIPSELVAAALVLVLSGCSRAPAEPPNKQTVLSTDVAPGAILIDVLGIGVSEPGQPEHYYHYEVHPSEGFVRKVQELTFEDRKHENIDGTPQEPTGTIETCARIPQAVSPDGAYLAYCTPAGSGEFFVDDKKTRATLQRGALGKWRAIRGFTWAPNSHSVAFLNTSSRLGKTPTELFSALSGHPVPHDTVFLSVLDVQTGKITEYLIRQDVPSSFTRILQWSE